METHTIKRISFAKNSLAGILRVVISAPALFLIVPFMINSLGQTLYGIWTLGSIVVSYASLSDLGLGVAVVKYTAQYAIEKEYTEINKLVTTTLLTFLLIGLSLSFFIWVLLDWIIGSLLKINMLYQEEARLVLIGFSLIFIINMLTGVFNSVLEGVQRMDLSNLLKTISLLSTVVATYISLSNKGGIKGLLIANIIIDILTYFINILVVKRVIPKFSIHYRNASIETLKNCLGYSLQIQAASLINMGFDPFNRVLITNIAGITFLPFYDLSNQLISQIRSVFTAATAPLMPMLSENSVNDFDKKGIVVIHRKSIRYLHMFGFIVFCIAIFFAKDFIGLWLGDQYLDTAFAIQVISIGWFASITATPAYHIFRGIGLPKYNTYSQLVLVISNILLGTVLGLAFGFKGIVVSISLALLINSIYLLAVIAKILGSMNEILSIKDSLFFCAIAVFSSSFFSFLYHYLPWQNYFSLGTFGLFTFVLYFVLLVITKVVNEGDFSSLVRFSFIRTIKYRLFNS